MSNSIYKNRFEYYQMMKDFADSKMDGQTFSRTFLSKRSKDLKEDKKNTPLKELLSKFFKDEISSDEYDKLSRPYKIYPEGSLFLKTFDELQAIDIEDFWPRDDEYFEEDENIDEAELRRRVKEKLKILDENRDKW
ncbi:hypothetical protein I862_01695 [endosymbiont of Acanthamoeba sp. UWC8]|uniref:hypothetical protein n=1 Tax=endosymbiont of Acanthamoeba sp. UWC8 TaxID=86106 RepID=UPI0004D118FE|nr:hypothetical protein [endosymbiont of Acanthamoeba sp. UWC8]AIF80902.1 hypothetical protein I862_01695 [endosymbiont of Acanthamoeba sp. UWC8]